MGNIHNMCSDFTHHVEQNSYLTRVLIKQKHCLFFVLSQLRVILELLKMQIYLSLY